MLIPIGNNVVLERIEEPDETESGLSIIYHEKKRMCAGMVSSIGNHKMHNLLENTKFDLRVGDIVIFGDFEGMDIDVEEDGKKYLVLPINRILASIT